MNEVDRYVYFMAAIGLLSLVALMVCFRRDLLRTVLIYGSIGGAVLPAAELLYIRDYWLPPTLLSMHPSIEDVLFGFAVSSFPIIVYPVLCKKYIGPTRYSRRLGTYISFSVIALLALLIGSLALGYNSIIVSCALLGSFTVVVCAIRRDLIRAAIFSLTVVTAVMIVTYSLFFNVFFPEWWAQYLLHAGNTLGTSVLGNIPLTELAVYITWAGFGATGHLFITGRGFVSEPRVS